MRRPRHALLAAAAAALLVAAGASQARVFWRWKADTREPAIVALGGQVAYRAPVVVNGGRGDVIVYAFRRPFSAVLNDLQQLAGLAFTSGPGGTLAMAETSDPTRRFRYIVLHVEAHNVTTVIEFSQPLADSRATDQPDPRHELDDIPEYPGSRPLFSASNLETDSGIAIALAAASPSEVVRFYESALLKDGWAPAIPPARPGPPPTGLYTRGKELCAVAADVNERGECRIALLHKRRGVQ